LRVGAVAAEMDEQRGRRSRALLFDGSSVDKDADRASLCVVVIGLVYE
jgi:hypothetical protein